MIMFWEKYRAQAVLGFFLADIRKLSFVWIIIPHTVKLANINSIKES